jgi:hypothetical protein
MDIVKMSVSVVFFVKNIRQTLVIFYISDISSIHYRHKCHIQPYRKQEYESWLKETFFYISQVYILNFL